jgi:hypothetical protein
MAFVHFDVKLCRILQNQVMNDSITAAIEVHQVWASTLIWQIFFIVKKSQYPPVVTSTINFTTA